MQDSPRLAAVYDDCSLRLGTFSRALCTTILTLIKRVGSLGPHVPGRTLGNLNRFLPLHYQRLTPQLNERLDLRLVTGWIRAQRLVPDLWKEQRIIPCPFRAGRACSRTGQQIRVLQIEWRILQVETDFALDPIAKLSHRQSFCLAVRENGTGTAMAWKTLHEGALLILGLEAGDFQRVGDSELAIVERRLRRWDQPG